MTDPAASGSPPRIAFAGTPEFAVPALEALHASGAEIPFVLTQPDRRAGRGRRLTAPPVKQRALELGLDVRQPSAAAELRATSRFGAAPDLVVVVAYGLLLPQAFLEWPRLGCLNVHASLLPRWRGAAPVQHAILAGDEATGVSLMRVTRRLDAGPVYRRRRVPIEAGDTAGELQVRLAREGAALLADSLAGVLEQRCRPEPQDEAAATYAPKLSKREARVDWHEDAVVLERRVRAFNPWPVCEACLDDGRRLRIWRATALAGGGEPPGRVVAAGPDGIDVATGAGLLRLEIVQADSARAVDAPAYLRSHPLGGASFVCD